MVTRVAGRLSTLVMVGIAVCVAGCAARRPIYQREAAATVARANGLRRPTEVRTPLLRDIGDTARYRIALVDGSYGTESIVLAARDDCGVWLSIFRLTPAERTTHTVCVAGEDADHVTLRSSFGRTDGGFHRDLDIEWLRPYVDRVLRGGRAERGVMPEGERYELVEIKRGAGRSHGLVSGLANALTLRDDRRAARLFDAFWSGAIGAGATWSHPDEPRRPASGLAIDLGMTLAEQLDASLMVARYRSITDDDAQEIEGGTLGVAARFFPWRSWNQAGSRLAEGSFLRVGLGASYVGRANDRESDTGLALTSGLGIRVHSVRREFAMTLELRHTFATTSGMPQMLGLLAGVEFYPFP